MRTLLIALLAATAMLPACGGRSSNGGGTPIPLTFSGNWQFTMAPPSDGSFVGGLQGGFLLQNSGSVSGGALYAVSLSQFVFPCNSGSAQITGTITETSSGQGVMLTAVAGTQTFSLNGTLSKYGSTMSGTYTSTAGTAGDGSPCGTAQTGLGWSAILVPPITGPVQGTFHSTGGASGLGEQDFLVSGGLTQAANTGASTATVTGSLTFLNSLTELSDYPCFTAASVSGQISGNLVNLQIIGTDGSSWGQIGEPPGSNGVTGVNPATFTSAPGGYMLNGAGPSYMVATAGCPGNLGNITTAGDYGNICLALNGASACQQPVSLTPSALIFVPQVVGSTPTMQTITVANASGATLGSLTLALTNTSGAANFTETDACGLNGVPSQGEPFYLESGQSCLVTITFAPLETCAPGTPPSQCPSPLSAILTVTSPSDDTIVTAPITDAEVNQGEAATRQFDFPVTPANPPSQDVEHHAETD